MLSDCENYVAFSAVLEGKTPDKLLLIKLIRCRFPKGNLKVELYPRGGKTLLFVYSLPPQAAELDYRLHRLHKRR